MQGRKLQLQMGDVQTASTEAIADVVDVSGEKHAHARAAKGTENSLECRPDFAEVIEKQEAWTRFDGTTQTASHPPLSAG
jgi:hypothetical protein